MAVILTFKQEQIRNTAVIVMNQHKYTFNGEEFMKHDLKFHFDICTLAYWTGGGERQMCVAGEGTKTHETKQ